MISNSCYITGFPAWYLSTLNFGYPFFGVWNQTHPVSPTYSLPLSTSQIEFGNQNLQILQANKENSQKEQIRSQIVHQNSFQLKQQKKLTKKDVQELKLSYRKVEWTQQNDRKLIELVKENKYTWVQISQQFPQATQKMCCTRYKRLIKNSGKYWTRQQDKIIIQLVKDCGERWKQISYSLPGRTPKQIRQHYLNILRPEIKKTPWTAQEDLKLYQLVQKNGNRWRFFQSYLPGRTQNHIKNRYYGRIKKILQAKSFTQKDL